MKGKGASFASVESGESKRFGNTTLPRAAEAISTRLHSALKQPNTHHTRAEQPKNSIQFNTHVGQPGDAVDANKRAHPHTSS